eukprot:scaffold15822_cov108-Isochrysis_galbana.AAC.7
MAGGTDVGIIALRHKRHLHARGFLSASAASRSRTCLRSRSHSRLASSSCSCTARRAAPAPAAAAALAPAMPVTKSRTALCRRSSSRRVEPGLVALSLDAEVGRRGLRQHRAAATGWGERGQRGRERLDGPVPSRGNPPGGRRVAGGFRLCDAV